MCVIGAFYWSNDISCNMRYRSDPSFFLGEGRMINTEEYNSYVSWERVIFSDSSFLKEISFCDTKPWVNVEIYYVLHMPKCLDYRES